MGKVVAPGDRAHRDEIKHGGGTRDDVSETAESYEISDKDDDAHTCGFGSRKELNHQGDEPAGEHGTEERGGEAYAHMSPTDFKERVLRSRIEDRGMRDAKGKKACAQ